MDLLNLYIKTNIKTTKLIDITVYCRLKRAEGTQYWFTFINAYNPYEYLLVIKKYKNYLKESETNKKISHFGKLENIISSLVKHELELYTPIDKELVYLIGVGLNHEIPTEKLLEYKVNHYHKGYNLDGCPVCKGSWVTQHAIPLSCKHRVCIDCIFGIIKNNGTSCPICRKPFII